MKINFNAQRFAVYTVVGWGSEVQYTGAQYQIKHAGVDKSGWSIGVMQTDFRSRPLDAEAFAMKYNTWASSPENNAIRFEDLAGSLGKPSSSLDIAQQASINRFLKTSDARDFVNQLDSIQATQVVSNRSTALDAGQYFQNLSAKDQFIVMATSSKVENQTGSSNQISALMQGKVVTNNGQSFQVLPTDDSPTIRQKVLDLTQSYGDAAAKGAAKAFYKASEMYDIFDSPAFAEARYYLNNPANSLSGAGASDAVQTQLSVLRVVAINAAEKTSSGTFIAYEGRLFKDPATGNQVIYSNGGAMVILPAQQGGWLMQGDQMVRYQDGEVLLRLAPNPATGRLQVTAVRPSSDEQADVVVAIGSSDGYSVNPAFNSEGAKPVFMADGSLVLFEGQGNPRVIVVLNGPFAGSIAAYSDRSVDDSGGNLRKVSFSGDNNDPSNNYYVVMNDGVGGVTTRDVQPITVNTDSGIITLGSTTVVTVTQNGIMLSETLSQDSTNPYSNQRTRTADTTLYTSTGGFASQAYSSTVTDSTGQQLNQLSVSYNAQGGITQTRLTERQADNSLLTTTRDGQGNTLSTANVQTFDDGSSLSTTTRPNGEVVQKSFDTESQLTGTITDTPDGAGGINRVATTVVNGKEVEITQHANAADLAVDSDNDGDFIDAGDFDSTAITIDGDAAVDSDLLEDAIDNSYQNASDIIEARGTGQLSQLISAGDAGDADGFTPAEGYSDQAGQETAWYETADAQRFGGSLAEIQSLVAALKSGEPLPIAVIVFNMAASASRSAELGTIAGGLNTLASLQGLRGALERGDELGALVSGAGFVDSAYNINHKRYKKRSCLRPNLLGYSTKTYLQTGEGRSKLIYGRYKNRMEAQKQGDLEGKGHQSRLFTYATSYEIDSV